jgi:hypothetical protein
MRKKKPLYTERSKGKTEKAERSFLTQGDIGCYRQYQNSPFIGGKWPPPIVIKFSHHLFRRSQNS